MSVLKKGLMAAVLVAGMTSAYADILGEGGFKAEDGRVLVPAGGESRDPWQDLRAEDGRAVIVPAADMDRPVFSAEDGRVLVVPAGGESRDPWQNLRAEDDMPVAMSAEVL